MNRSMHFGRYDFASFFGFIAYASSSMIIPMVLYPLALDMKFPLQEGGCGLGGALQMGRSISMVFAMLFCGFLAAHSGKAKTLGFAVLVMGCGILSAAFAPGYIFLFLSVVFAGLGEGVVEGIATPFIQDQHEEEPGRYINFTHGFWSIGVLLTVLVVGFLLTLGVSWRILTAAVGLLVLFPSLLYLLPDKKGVLKPGQQNVSAGEVMRNTKTILARPRFWLFFFAMFLAGGGEYCLTFWTASFIRMEFTGSSMWLAGLGTACFAGGMIVGRLGSGFLFRQNQLSPLVIWTGFLAAGISLLFPFLHGIWIFMALLFFAGIATGPFWPSIQSYSTDRLPGTDMTMLFVLLSCAGVPGCGFFTWFMGLAGDWFGMRTSLYLVAISFGGMSLLMVLDRLIPLKQQK